MPQSDILRFLSSFAIAVVAIASTGCDRGAASGLKGQTNTTITYYAKAVDQDGDPLQGAHFEYRIEAYPKDWTFDSRGRESDVSRVAVVSDAQGRFQFTVTACKLIQMKAERNGYRYLFDWQSPAGNGGNRFYRIISWSDLCYKTDADHPAIFVFVKDGVNLVSALPCRGGYDSGGGTRWIMNKPEWPQAPSLVDVDLKGSQPRVNQDFDVYVRVVDEITKPVKGAQVWLDYRGYRDREKMRQEVKCRPDDFRGYLRTEKFRSEPIRTDSDGRAVVHIRGFELLAAYVDARPRRSFVGDTNPKDQNGYAANLLKDGEAVWKSTWDRPLILVVVAEDAEEVSQLPSRGGLELKDGNWIPVEPFWPQNERATKIVRQSTTQQSS